MVVHNGESAAVDGEEVEHLPQSRDDPILAMGVVVAAEPGVPHATRDAVIPGRDRFVDELRAWGGDRGTLLGEEKLQRKSSVVHSNDEIPHVVMW